MRETLPVSQEPVFDLKAALASIAVVLVLSYIHSVSQPKDLREEPLQGSMSEIVKIMPAFWQQHFQVK